MTGPTDEEVTRQDDAPARGNRDWINASHLPDPEEIWQCPCGFTGPYRTVVPHRKGYKTRPACAVGKITRADPERQPPPPPITAVDAAYGEDLPQVEDAPERQRKPSWEATLEDAEDDPELLAELYLRQRHTGNGSNGHGPVDPNDLLGSLGGAPGDFERMDPAVPTLPSQYRENVLLPAVFRIMYDFMKAQGWKQGDGSMSAWVVDMLMDHWRSCLGKAVVVVDREDIQVEGT